MSGWRSFLRADPSDWLLEDSNPSVAYATRVELLGESATGRRATKARKAIMVEGVVPSILAKETRGSWNQPGKHYTEKYRGTVWQLLVLAEHYADGSHPGIRAACNYILDCSQDLESGGFSVETAIRTGGGRHSGVIPCLTGNMVWSLARLGFVGDPRLDAGIEWITKFQRFDDGVASVPVGWPYDRFEMCWGRHTCHMGAAKALKALAILPKSRRTPQVEDTVQRGAEYFLIHHVFKKSHDLKQTAKPGWRRFQFPLMYQTDALEVTGTLLDLGYKDNRLQDAVDLILSKQDPAGRWSLEATFNGRFQVNVETKGKPSKWITLGALKVLKGYFGE